MKLLILVALATVAGLTVVELRVVDLGLGLPVANAILVFALINTNGLLIFILLFLVARHLVKLLLERRSELLGAKLRTKLVASFMALTLAPTVALYFLSLQFIGASLEYWLEAQLDRPLQEALQVGREAYRSAVEQVESLAQGLGQEVQAGDLLGPQRRAELAAWLTGRWAALGLTGLAVLGPDLQPLASAGLTWPELKPLGGLAPDLVAEAARKNEVRSDLVVTSLADYATAAAPVIKVTGLAPVVVVATKTLSGGLAGRLSVISQGLEEYEQLRLLKGPLKLSHYLTLTLATMLIIFGAVWFGLQLAKGLTGPLQDLAAATRRLAGGDYDFTLQARGQDEMGTLVAAFNRMTRDLKASRESLERANRELAATNRENERRRDYMEIVLANVAAGVIALDQAGLTTTFNPSAEAILGLRAGDVLGQPLSRFLAPEQAVLLGELTQAAAKSPGGRIERQVRLTLGSQAVSLLLRLTQLRDEAGKGLGLVVVIEDLTELERAQRMAAWREVARRIAHEIKNPLTPIKLSAQRLMKRFGGEVAEKDVFDQAVTTIVDQADALKGLVDEFSAFARMPSASLEQADLGAILGEVLALFKEAHKEIAFEVVVKTPPPAFPFDPTQIKRVLINLLGNAVAALEGQPEPRITIRLNYLAELKLARIEVADNGPGLTGETRERLFEPYYSTKRQGVGLGLAIVKTIIQDHNGYIRVQDNAPRGTKFIIELPCGGWTAELEEEVKKDAPNHPRG